MHKPPDTQACVNFRAAGPTEGNRKHHPKVAPSEISHGLSVGAADSSGVQPTPENGVRLRLWPPDQEAVATAAAVRRRRLSPRRATARHYTTRFAQSNRHSTRAVRRGGQWHAGCVRGATAQCSAMTRAEG